jgi:ribosomal protein L6P/L9E
MSRIGKEPITVPAGVDVTLEPQFVRVKGPKGTLERVLPKDIVVSQEGNTITVTRPTESGEHRSLHGLTRTLIANLVQGVTEEFTKNLEIHGVGYRCALKGDTLELSLGYPPPPVSRSGERTKSWSARSQQTSEPSASRTPTSRRVSATPVRSFGRRQGRRPSENF